MVVSGAAEELERFLLPLSLFFSLCRAVYVVVSTNDVTQCTLGRKRALLLLLLPSLLPIPFGDHKCGGWNPRCARRGGVGNIGAEQRDVDL